MANYSILVDATFETSQIQKKLKEAARDVDVKINVDAENAKQQINDLELNFNAANEVFSKTIDIISSLSEQVFELDGALTEFRKVSDLQGSALDDYVDKLTQIGLEVGRTGSEMVESTA